MSTVSTSHESNSADTQQVRSRRVQIYALQMKKLRCKMLKTKDLAPVVQKLVSAIHRIKIYPVVNVIGFPNTYPLDSDLSCG